MTLDSLNSMIEQWSMESGGDAAVAYRRYLKALAPVRDSVRMVAEYIERQSDQTAVIRHVDVVGWDAEPLALQLQEACATQLSVQQRELDELILGSAEEQMPWEVTDCVVAWDLFHRIDPRTAREVVVPRLVEAYAPGTLFILRFPIEFPGVPTPVLRTDAVATQGHRVYDVVDMCISAQCTIADLGILAMSQLFIGARSRER